MNQNQIIDEKIQRMDKEEKRLARKAKRLAKKEAKARIEKRGATSNSVIRFILVALAVIIQILLIVLLIYFLIANQSDVGAIFNSIIELVAIIFVIFLVGRDWQAQFKISWAIFILLFPLLGILLYLMIGRTGTTGRRKRKKYQEINHLIRPYFSQKPDVLEKFKNESPDIYSQAYYLAYKGHYPIYQNTDITYFKDAKDGLLSQIEDMKKAKKFIFFEYHAIENAESFEPIKEILKEKVKEGVDVRLFYDDMGSIGFLNGSFIKEMKSYGIKCRVFNKLTPLMLFFMNNRDHRKITVIDGKVGYTGGYNMANEYFNVTHPYGKWKDVGIRLEGDAVKSLTLIFLENWYGMKNDGEDISQFVIDYKYEAKDKDAYCVPYADGPIYHEPLAENAYLNIINNSHKYCYICTPYLIITDEMNRALINAAKRGVDVKIMMPGIPDKKSIYSMSRSYYPSLVHGGVHIYEYKPGFLHAKMVVSDDETAIIGTINFDYRSLYHHFENAVLLHKNKCIADMRDDYVTTLSECRNVDVKFNRYKRLGFWKTIFRLFAPLM